jgi:NitT/TauT family transport system permease protein
MHRIYAPPSVVRRKATPAPHAWYIDVALILAVVAAIYGVILAAARWTAAATPNVPIDLSYRTLPLYAGLSTLRMAIAYLIALVFSIVYARVAIVSRIAERIMLPLLDILQSIPILSFLPGVVLGMVALFPRSNIGLELAAIVLIFTSQAWNMAFSFHQSLLTIPKELREVATIYQLSFWQRFIRLELPFGVIPLIWNSMMSWAGGWFFLMAAEQFTLGNHNFRLPGLGSYLQTAANRGDVPALLLGLATLIAVIVLLDRFLWRPLVAWSDRFKFEQTEGSAAPTSAVLAALRRSVLLAWMRQHVLRPVGNRLDRLVVRPRATPGTRLTVVAKDTRRPLPLRRVLGVAIVLALAAAVAGGAVAAARFLIQLDAADWTSIAVSAGASVLRTIAALAIGVAWTVPLGVAIGMNPRWAQRAQPLVQMVASIPATALFPALLLVLIGLPGGLNVAAVALMLLGTQWYILFNVIAGAMAIPGDLRETAVIYKLRGWRRWRYLILPAIFPYLVTGMITATGGAWNATIVAEYVTFDNRTFSTVGLGALIAGSANSGNFALLLAATLTMAAIVVTINRLVWRRLYRLAEQRFRLD